MQSEGEFFEEKALFYTYYLNKNSIISSSAKLIRKIILEENRIPEIKLKLAFKYSDSQNKNHDKTNISGVKAFYESNEKAYYYNPLDSLIYNPAKQLFDNFKNFTATSTDIRTKLEKGLLVDEAFLVFEHLLSVSSISINSITTQNLNFNFSSSSGTTIKERILNVLNELVNAKQKENAILTQKLKANEDNKSKLLEKYTKLKEFYLNKISEFSQELKANNQSNADFDAKIIFIEQAESLAKKSIRSLSEDIKFYSETFSKDEKQYAELVERTKFIVKAINQIKKYMINTFANFKDYLLSRKL